MNSKKTLIGVVLIALVIYLIWAYASKKFPFSINQDNNTGISKSKGVPSEITITSDPATIYTRVMVRYDSNGNIITDKNKIAEKVVPVAVRTGRTANAGSVYPTNGIEFIINKDGLTYQYYSIGNVGGDYVLKDDAKVIATKTIN